MTRQTTGQSDKCFFPQLSPAFAITQDSIDKTSSYRILLLSKFLSFKIFLPFALFSSTSVPICTGKQFAWKGSFSITLKVKAAHHVCRYNVTALITISYVYLDSHFHITHNTVSYNTFLVS